MREVLWLLALLIIGADVGEAQAPSGDDDDPKPTNLTALRIQGFVDDVNAIRVTIANTTLAQFEGPTGLPPTTASGTSPGRPMSSTGGGDGQDSVQTSLSVLLSSAVATYCVQNASVCKLNGTTASISTVLAEEDAVAYFPKNYTEDPVTKEFSLVALYHVPAGRPDVRVDTATELFMTAAVLSAALAQHLTRVCAGEINATVEILTYQTLTGRVVNASCPPPTSPTMATTTMAAGTGVPTTQPAVTTPAAANTTSATATTQSTVAAANVTTSSPSATPMVATATVASGTAVASSSGAPMSSMNATTSATSVQTTPAITATAMDTTDGRDSSGSEPAESLAVFAIYRFSGVEEATFRSTTGGAVLTYVEGIITNNCTASNNAMPDIELEPSISIDGAVIVFTLRYVMTAQAAEVSCASIGEGSTLQDQLGNYFTGTEAVDDVTGVLPSGTSLMASIQTAPPVVTTTAADPGDADASTGLSTGAIVGIVVGCVVGAGIIGVAGILFAQHGSGNASLVKSVSTAKIVPSEEGNTELTSQLPTEPPQAWAETAEGHV